MSSEDIQAIIRAASSVEIVHSTHRELSSILQGRTANKSQSGVRKSLVTLQPSALKVTSSDLGEKSLVRLRSKDLRSDQSHVLERKSCEEVRTSSSLKKDTSVQKPPKTSTLNFQRKVPISALEFDVQIKESPNFVTSELQKPSRTEEMASVSKEPSNDELISRRIIKTPRAFNDVIDVSRHPSYTNFQLPYEVVCRQRYHQAKKKYDKQFLYELQKLEAMQLTAYETLRFNRIFAITTLWPPLHTKKEVDYVLREFYKMPPKQQARLNYLLKEKQF